ncbi:MAG: DUF1615 family protein [Dokdonella sp.]|nr:DUF1615 family protein [Dokdonella sp.]
MSRRAFGASIVCRFNPVRTGGPMQVSIAFAERHAADHANPFAADGSIRHAVFTRRGGLIAFRYRPPARLSDQLSTAPVPVCRFRCRLVCQSQCRVQSRARHCHRRALALDGDLLVPGRLSAA